MTKPTLLLLDSNYLCYRPKFSMPPLGSEEIETHIIFNFLLTVFKLADQFETQNIVLPFDSKHSLRKQIYPGYKDRNNEDKTYNEEQIDSSFAKQVHLIRTEILPGLGFNNIPYQHGYESDDSMHQFCIDYHDKYDIIMVTRDHDMFQTLDYCTICWPVKTKNKTNWELYTYADFVEEWGVEPKDWVDIKARGGCSSDTIKGIAGIGEKKVCQYLNGKMNVKTKTFRKILMLSPYFQKVNTPIVKLPFEGTNHYELQRNSFSKQKFVDMCEKYEFNSFLNGITMDRWENIFCKPTPRRK